MLEWLKTILGEQYTDDIDKKVSAEIGKVFVSKTDFNTLNETKKTLEKQIGERDKQLGELQKLKPEELQAEITRLQGENNTVKQKYDADLKAAKLDYALNAHLIKAGAVNTKAVKALLDESKIILDGDNLLGLDEQLKSLKETEKWAFKPETSNIPGNGGNPASPPPPIKPEPQPAKPVSESVQDKMAQLFKI